MKCALLLIFINYLLFSDFNRNVRSCKYSIQIKDVNSSLAYSNIYSLDNDSLKVIFSSGLEKEHDKVIFARKLLATDNQIIYSYISSISIDTFKVQYSNPNVLDGDEKIVRLQFNGVVKEISVYNYYIKSLDSLFQIVNRLIPNNLKMPYVDRSRKKG